jgi:hypothetical protein
MTTKEPCQPDFPAAHSMDTTWFAVDRDGHIGVFDSRKPGVVPEAVTCQGDEIAEDLAVRPETGEPKLDLSGVFHPGLRNQTQPRRSFRPMDELGEDYTQLLLFRDDSELPPAVRAIPGVRVEAVDGMVAVWMRPEAGRRGREAWTAFIRQAAAGRTGVSSDFHGCWDIDFARRGIFAYRAHTDRFNMPEPYGRLFTPVRPLIVGDAPPPLRDQLAKRVHLDVSFASSPYIQPAELVPCQTWASAAYLASDGFTVRPLPGAERADYLELAAHIRDGRIPDDDVFKPVVFDPPVTP